MKIPRIFWFSGSHAPAFFWFPRAGVEPIHDAPASSVFPIHTIITFHKTFLVPKGVIKMGRSRYQIFENNAPHFLTSTIINWIPLFTRPPTVQILLDALAYRQQHCGLKIYGYVILENHLHWIAQAENLKKEIASFKSYTARLLIQYLQQQQVKKILKQLAFYKKLHKTDRQYQVWEEGSHPQLIQNEEMLRQKLDYIHYNPVKRGYVDEPVHWRYSSARNYAQREGLLPIFTDWWTS